MPLTLGFVKNAPTTPLDGRLMDAATLVAESDGSPRTGVLGYVSGLVTTNGDTAPMSLSVGAAGFVCSKSKADGVTRPTNDGLVKVTIGAAPGTAGTSRYDVLWVRHNDNTTGDANSLPTFGITSGAPLASPVVPATPAGATKLGHLRIYSGTTSTAGGANIWTPTYQMTTGVGGTVPFRSLAELKAWTTPKIGQRATVNGEAGVGSVPGEWEWTGLRWAPCFSLVGNYTVPMNVPNGQLTTLSNTPTLQANESSTLIGEAISPRVGGGFNILQDGIYLIDGPFTANISGTLQKLDARYFVDVNATGMSARRLQLYGHPVEDTAHLSTARVVLKAGDTLQFSVYQARGTTITFAWRPCITYLGPIA